jgi:hypothetical protein
LVAEPTSTLFKSAQKPSGSILLVRLSVALGTLARGGSSGRASQFQ